MSHHKKEMEHYLTGLVQSVHFSFHNDLCHSVSDGFVVLPVHKILVYWSGFFTLGVMKI